MILTDKMTGDLQTLLKEGQCPHCKKLLNFGLGDSYRSPVYVAFCCGKPQSISTEGGYCYQRNATVWLDQYVSVD